MKCRKSEVIVAVFCFLRFNYRSIAKLYETLQHCGSSQLIDLGVMMSMQACDDFCTKER